MQPAISHSSSTRAPRRTAAELVAPRRTRLAALAGYPARAPWLLAAPAGLVLVVFMIGPMTLTGIVSFLGRKPTGMIDWHSATTQAYVSLLFDHDFDGSLIVNSDYVFIFLRSFVEALVTTILCLLIAIPTALYMALQEKTHRILLVFLVTVPFWTNLLVRNYAWILILRTHGLIDSLLHSFGIVGNPFDILYTDYAIVAGLVYSFIPFMVLPIFASFDKLDWRLVEAAYDLGAGRLRTLQRVVLPLSLPGIVAGCLLVFIPCLGAYATPALLGGSKALMIGSLIQLQFGEARNWPFGAALSFVLLGSVLLAIMAYLIWIARRRRVMGLAAAGLGG
jgi:spermidine/putrescine transport system permease protein